MTTPEATMPQRRTLETVRPHAIYPNQPDPAGWRTNTASHIQSYARETHTALQTGTGTSDALTQYRHHVRQALLDAVSDEHVDVHAANTLLQTLDLPLLPHRWQVRVVLPLLIEVTATTREDAFQAAEAAVEAALTNANLAVQIEWDGCERDGADPGDFDRTPPQNHVHDQHLAP
ncbi:hypothetical protein E1193_19020 [Micromonospora sp. KC606]|uniref:hypothetical protein n=1 Tax=Micromonospora sp. KC606 TaxID=2530379 RepID=UPI00104A9FC3|nr:hypothetical protein [Micromonospora sp. KC606]TDC79511.1 hypothetical protein E1193_19020 [Micromonospora sp. KC606]